MNNSLISRFILAASCCVATMAVAQGPDELWEVTTKMEMSGMSMPGRTDKICKLKGDRDPSKLGEKDKDSDCKMVDSKQSGNRSTWKIVCTKPEPMTGTGDMTHSGDKFDGTIKMSGKSDGEAYTMTQVLSGKKVGSCKYEDPGKKAEQMQAQSQAQSQAGIDKECDQQIEKLQSGMIMGGEGMPPEYMICKHRKAEFCARASKVAQQMKDSAGFTDAVSKYPYWRPAMQGCGIDPNTVSGPVCKSAIEKKTWTFVADYCPAEGRALAQKHCVGMDYSAVMESEYRLVCQKYGDDLARKTSARRRRKPHRPPPPSRTRTKQLTLSRKVPTSLRSFSSSSSQLSLRPTTKARRTRRNTKTIG